VKKYQKPTVDDDSVVGAWGGETEAKSDLMWAVLKGSAYDSKAMDILND
jgi:hypothetical protein